MPNILRNLRAIQKTISLPTMTAVSPIREFSHKPEQKKSVEEMRKQTEEQCLETLARKEHARKINQQRHMLLKNYIIPGVTFFGATTLISSLAYGTSQGNERINPAELPTIR